MIGESELVDAIEKLDAIALQRWIALGWVLPRGDESRVLFDTSDVARVRLICELRYELLIEEGSMPVVLSLMDQLYATRRALGAVLSVIEELPDDVRTVIAARIASKS